MVFLKSLAVFIGTVIGVGIFGLPFVALKAGFFVVFLYFLFMVLIVVLINLLYAKIAIGTRDTLRLPGYVEEYLGKKWKKVTFFIIAIGLMGALLAYLIIGGEFLKSFFGPYFGGGAILYTLIFFAFGTYLVFRDIKSISGVELSLVVGFVVILILIFGKALPAINFDYFKTFNLKFLTFPYGVILFSLWGAALIPEIEEMFKVSGLKKEKEIRKSLRNVILFGVIFSALVYLFFIFIVLGVSGPQTSKEAISGLEKVLDSNVVKLAFIFGVFTCFTSFITLALTLKKVLWYDLGFPKNFAWFLTCFLPLILFLFGVREFISIISFTGAVALGLEGIIIVFLYREFLRKKLFKKMNPGLYFLVGVFALGIILEIFYFLVKMK